MRPHCLLLLILFATSSALFAAPTSDPSDALGKLAHISVDVPKKQVRVDCTMLGIDTPLEFFCVLKGTNEHESVLRTEAVPSQIHFALLMLGLDPGDPVHFVEATKKWIPPAGTAVSISVEFTKNGKSIVLPATALIRDIHDKKRQPAHTWIFTGSKIGPDGAYAADITGYVVSVVNFDLTMIDIPELASSANETLEWEIDKSVAPPPGSAVTMIIEPAIGTPPPVAAVANEKIVDRSPIDLHVVKIREDGSLLLNDAPVTRAELVERFKQMQSTGRTTARIASLPQQRDLAVAIASDLRDLGVAIESAPATRAANDASPDPTDPAAPAALSPGTQELIRRWNQAVGGRKDALEQAARAHASIIAELRQQQQSLVEQADALQRVIDNLDQQYRDLTVPPTTSPSTNEPR